MASGSKVFGKQPATTARDWRHRIDYESQAPLQTQEQLAVLRCPFYLTPEPSDDIVPPDYNRHLEFFDGEKSVGVVPWTGYYAPYRTARIAVANAYGVWFEITREHGQFRAIRPARKSLHLKDWPVEGIDMGLLLETGEPIPASRAPSQAPSMHTEHSEQIPPPQTIPVSSQTQRGRRGGGPP